MEESRGKNLKARAAAETVQEYSQLAFHNLLSLLSYTTHSGLDPATSIINQENFP